MSEKVFLCSLDGATWDILEPLVQSGDLPTLSSLIDQGVSTDLASTLPPSSPTAWTSFLTGLEPSTHGILDFTHLNESNEVVQQTAFGTGFPTLWSMLKDRSYRTHSLNVPMTYPASPVDGTMVSGLPAPSISTTSTYPDDLSSRIETQYSPYHVAPDHIQELSEYSLSEYVDYIVDSLTHKFHLAEAQLADGDWDVGMVHIHETDIIQHCLWQYLDDSHPEYDPDSYDCVVDVYRAIDKHLGSLLELFPDDTTVFVLSDHGFRQNETEIFINRWLQEQGYLQMPAVSSVQASVYSFIKNNVSSRLADGIRDVVTTSGESSESSSLPPVYSEAFQNDQTVAFSYGRRSAKLYVRDDRIVDELISKLKTLQVDGETVVQDVHRFCDVDGPDLIIEPVPPFSFESSLTSDTLVKTVDYKTDSHVGTHAHEGIFVANGPEIATDVTVENAGITDLLPTVLYTLDEPIPNHIDGELLRQVFDSAELETNPPETIDMDVTGNADMEHGDTEDVQERLKDLGYL